MEAHTPTVLRKRAADWRLAPRSVPGRDNLSLDYVVLGQEIIRQLLALQHSPVPRPKDRGTRLFCLLSSDPCFEPRGSHLTGWLVSPTSGVNLSSCPSNCIRYPPTGDGSRKIRSGLQRIPDFLQLLAAGTTDGVPLPHAPRSCAQITSGAGVLARIPADQNLVSSCNDVWASLASIPRLDGFIGELECAHKLPASRTGSGDDCVATSRNMGEVSGRTYDGTEDSFPSTIPSDDERGWAPPPPKPFVVGFQHASVKRNRRRKSASEKRKQQVPWQQGPLVYNPKSFPASPEGKGNISVASKLITPLDEVSSGADQSQSKGKGNAAQIGMRAVHPGSLLERIGSLCLIPDTELELNRQEQADEITALEAIFGEDFVVFENRKDGSPTFTMSIHVETAASVAVAAQLPSLSLPPSQGSTLTRLSDSLSSRDGGSSASASGRSVSSGILQEFNVQFLPPISLMCTLPPTYPSRSPPNFVVRAWWLTQPSLASLCRGLDTIWDTQPGQVVCYTWASWLQENSLRHLGYVDKIMLGTWKESDEGRPFNVRAIAEDIPVDVVITRLLRYNEEKHYEQFCRSLHCCNICFSELPGKDFPKLTCQHTFCRTCMGQYCAGLVKEGSVNKLVCPDTSCKGQIAPFVLKELLSDSDFMRWEDLTLKRALDAMTDIEYCPRCESVCIEDKDHHVQCGSCFFSFCSLCRAPWHVVEKCASPEELLVILQERQGRAQQGEGQRRKEQNRINDILSMKVVNAQSKRCPTCQAAISKTGGCNKMYCTYCLNYFCFVCGVRIHDYLHFGQDKCALLDREEIERWEAMEDHQR